MRKAIWQKLDSLKTLNPQSVEFKNWVNDSNLWMFVYSALAANGREVGKQDLVKALNGEIIEDFSVSLYMEIQRLSALYKDMCECKALQYSLDSKILARWANILFESTEYRASNAAIFQWGIIPCRFLEIDEHLQKLFKGLKAQNCIDRAVFVHNEINRIYPYGQDTPEMAIACMYYILMVGGYPMPTISVYQDEYDKMMYGYFKDGSQEFMLMAERIILDRLEQMVQLAIAAGEKK